MAKPGKVAGPRAQQYRIQYPLTAVEVEHIDTMFETLFRMFWNNGILINVGQITGVLPVINGGTGDSAFTPYSLIVGGATPTGQLQQVSGQGTTTQVLTSNGSGTLPTWQAASSFNPAVIEAEITVLQAEVAALQTTSNTLTTDIITLQTQIAALQAQAGPLTLSNLPINANVAGINIIIPAQPGKVISVYRIYMISASTVNVTPMDGYFNALSGPLTLGSFVLDLSAVPWYVTAPGDPFVLGLSSAVQVSGGVYYTQM